MWAVSKYAMGFFSFRLFYLDKPFTFHGIAVSF